jgi:outer membrane immunogenic protein
VRRLALLAAVAAFTTTPALASGEGRVEMQLGYDSIDGESGLSYGGVVGYDFDLDQGAFLGVELGASESTADSLGVEAGRDLRAAARFGIHVLEDGKVYGLVGYSNQRFTVPGVGHTDLDGVVFGAGYQHNFTAGLYGKVEYRYTNYELGADRHTAVVGLGANF